MKAFVHHLRQSFAPLPGSTGCRLADLLVITHPGTTNGKGQAHFFEIKLSMHTQESIQTYTTVLISFLSPKPIAFVSSS